ncbi:hypothetical protein WJX77_001091 [Trebouxia sp. C0004]
MQVIPLPQLAVNIVLGRIVLPMKYISESPLGIDPLCIYEFSSYFSLGFAAMTSCHVFYILKDVYLACTKSSNKPASSHPPYMLYSVLSRERNPIPSFLQPRFWKTALPAAVTVFLLFPPLSISLVASPMDSIFLTNATYSVHPDDSCVQPTWASHTPPDRHYHINPSWQWHSRPSFGTCILNPPQAYRQYAWGDSAWPLRLHSSSFCSASLPTCDMSSSGTNIEQQLIASDLPKPNSLQSKALVAVSEALVSDTKNSAAPIAELCKLGLVTLSQPSLQSFSGYMASALQRLAISSADDLLNQPFQAAKASKVHYTALTEQHAAASSINILKALESAVDTAANSLTLSCMSLVFQMPDILCTASAAAAGTAAVLLTSEVSACIMQMMPANSAVQVSMVIGLADSIFFWVNVTNTTFAIV